MRVGGFQMAEHSPGDCASVHVRTATSEAVEVQRAREGGGVGLAERDEEGWQTQNVADLQLHDYQRGQINVVVEGPRRGEGGPTGGGPAASATGPARAAAPSATAPHDGASRAQAHAQRQPLAPPPGGENPAGALTGARAAPGQSATATASVSDSHESQGVVWLECD
jgi:hypothetical protein